MHSHPRRGPQTGRLTHGIPGAGQVDGIRFRDAQLIKDTIHIRSLDQYLPASASHTTRARSHTRALTARILADPVRLRTEEAIYESDWYQIADDLDITVPVLTDYATLRHELTA